MELQNGEQPQTSRFTKLETHAVETPEGRVDVEWKTYLPETTEPRTSLQHIFSGNNKRIIFVPGYPLKASAQSINPFVTALGEESATPTTVFSGIHEKLHPSQSAIAEALAQYVRNVQEQHNIAKPLELILVGHSRGADIASRTAVLLQDDNQFIHVNGLIMLNPAGFFEQGIAEFIKSGLLKDTQAPQRDAEKSGEEGLALKKLNAQDNNTGVLQRKRRRQIPWEFIDILKKNEVLEKLDPQIPLVVLSGNSDSLFPPDKIRENMNGRGFFEEKNIANPPKPEGIIVVASKQDSHAGTLLYRPDTVAKVGLYGIERSRRNPSDIQTVEKSA